MRSSQHALHVITLITENNCNFLVLLSKETMLELLYM